MTGTTSGRQAPKRWRQAVSFLTRRGGPDRFWVRLDADVFDQTIMQSVDDPRPDGLTWDNGIAILRTALASTRAAGLQVAIYTRRSTRTDPTAAGWQSLCEARLPDSSWSRRGGPGPAGWAARHGRLSGHGW